MSTITFHRPNLSGFLRNGNRFHSASAYPIMSLNLPSSQSKTQENLSLKLQNPTVLDIQTSKAPDIRFDRIQTPDECDTHKLEFGQFVAREALVDEEYWTAAWLRAESHWEDRPPERYIESYKRKFADQEFNALKKKCNGKLLQKCSCIVVMKKEDKNIKRTIIKSIVGTLDLSIRYLSEGENFSGEKAMTPTFSSINRMSHHRYAYVSNLCVSKHARRKGIASNMLRFAIQSAKLKGIEHIYVHVHKENTRALDLYKKMGFEIVEMDTPNLSSDENYLMKLKS
ncbi:N-terminal methionine N(alpha)-acetyltransferase NatE [Ranunculus cassubicifolius]